MMVQSTICPFKHMLRRRRKSGPFQLLVFLAMTVCLVSLNMESCYQLDFYPYFASIERKSRFEIQHKTPPSNQSSIHGPQELHVKFDSLPLSRENSISVSRESSCHGKVSRFSVEKEERDGGNKEISQQQQQQVCEYPAVSPECRKKGRFELTGGSSTPGDVAKHDTAHHADSPQSSLSCSPSTSPCSSLSRGQTGRLFDPSMPQMMHSHMETLLKQLDAQKSLVQDMMLGMSMVYGTPASSDARSVQARSRASSSDSKRSHSETAQEA